MTLFTANYLCLFSYDTSTVRYVGLCVGDDISFVFISVIESPACIHPYKFFANIVIVFSITTAFIS